jgi:[ribosomal protein S5]-alanine N-acetyltransferase
LSEVIESLCLVSERLEIRAAAVTDAYSLAEFFRRNREHFKPWDPPGPPGRFTVAYWERNLARAVDDWKADRALRLHMFEKHDLERVVGRIGFSQIMRGGFQSCMLGYQLDEICEGHGLMYEALQSAIGFMFQRHHLHRIQANHLEENLRSARLLERLGFVREGLAPKYLFIRGEWRDHVLNSLINPDFDPSRLGAE